MKKKDICRLKRCLTDLKTKDHLCLYPKLFCSYISGPWNWFVKWSMVPPSVGLGLFLFVFVSSFDFEHHCIGLVFSCSKFFDPLDFSSCPLALYGHLWWLRIFLCPPVLFGHFHRWRLVHAPKSYLGTFNHYGFCCTRPPVWGVILAKVIFQENLLGSKGDYKWYISALWKIIKDGLSSSQMHTFRIGKPCFHASMQSDFSLFMQVKPSFRVTSWCVFFFWVF